MPNSYRLYIVALVGLITVGTPRAEACERTVTLRGETRLVAQVRDALRAVDIDCKGLEVVVRPDEGGRIRVTIVRGARRVIRSVASVATVQDLVVSRVRSAILTEPLAIIRRDTVAPGISDPVGSGRASVSKAIEFRAMTGSGIAVAAEVGFDRDSRTWKGVVITGCLRVGRLCLGGLIRNASASRSEYEHNVEDVGTFATTLAADANALDVVASAELPLSWRRWRISPQVQLGYGQLTSRSQPRYASSLPNPVFNKAIRSGVRLTAARRIGTDYAFELSTAVDTMSSTGLDYMEIYQDGMPRLVPLADRSRHIVFRVSLGFRHGG